MPDWNQEQAAREHILRAFAEQSKAQEAKAKEAIEVRELLTAFIDAKVLGIKITKEQWERACFLCNRWVPPFVEKPIKP